MEDDHGNLLGHLCNLCSPATLTSSYLWGDVNSNNLCYGAFVSVCQFRNSISCKVLSLFQMVISGSLQNISVVFMNKPTQWSHDVFWVPMPLLDTDTLSVEYFHQVLPSLSGTEAQPACHCHFFWGPCSPSAEAWGPLRVFFRISLIPRTVKENTFLSSV